MRIEPAAAVRGDIAVLGDKSISHRALLVAAIAEGESEIRGFGASDDTLASARALEALGAGAEVDGDRARVRGVGLRGLRPPDGAIDCGNAGTLMRLLPGILAGQKGRFQLVGDESLSRARASRRATAMRRSSSRAGRCGRSGIASPSRARR
jgi:3-phosphoshikimate 1-carboxyvinyltransferase